MKHTQEHEFHDEGSLHKWRTELPNIVFELGLTPYELALYSHLKRSTGGSVNRKCWKSTATLAKETKMSVGQVSAAKQSLCKNRPELGNLPLIRVAEEKRVGKQKPKHIMVLTDIWEANFAFFSAAKPCSPHEHVPSNDVHTMNMDVHTMNVPCSPHELKKEQIEERTNKETPPPPPQAESSVSNSSIQSPIYHALFEVCALTSDALTGRDRQQLERIVPWLASKGIGDEQQTAAAIKARFGRPTWKKDTPPFLSQITEQNWLRATSILESQQQSQQSQGANNATPQRNFAPSPRNGRRDKNDIHREQMALMRELGVG